MPRGVSKEREREYDKLKNRFKTERRYGGREEEVAARIVNKQRARYGETKGAEAARAKGEAPDRALPIRGYQRLTVPELKKRIGKLSQAEMKQVRKYETQHKDRKTLLREIDRYLH